MATLKPASPLKVNELHFDSSNPRLFTGDIHGATDDEVIIRSLNEIAPLNELLLSISQNGYIDVEPLIVTSRPEGGYRVLEGNRRLATLRLLTNPALASKLKIPLPESASRGDLDLPDEILTICVDSEEEVRTYIGFKHINGPYRWHAYAKARYVTEWYKKERVNGLTIDKIAVLLGDDNKTIRDYVGGMLVLEQAEDAGLFSVDDKYKRGPFAFSHLYTALGRKEYVEFLGLPKRWSDQPGDEPIPQAKLEALGEVLRYIYGSNRDKFEPLVQSQNPHLKQLGEALVHPVALAQIRGGATLTEAYNEVRPQDEVFSEALVIAHQAVKTVLNHATKYAGEPHLMKISEDLKAHAEIIYNMMQTKAQAQKASQNKTP